MPTATNREQRTEQALFLGGQLTLDNPNYLDAVRTLTDLLLKEDLTPCDLTVKAMGFEPERVSAVVIGRENGVAAGLAEFSWLLSRFDIGVKLEKKDGEIFGPEEVLARLSGDRSMLLSLERVGLNLLQRMSGIATETRVLQGHARNISDPARIVATRKTPWGLLDKRAVHLGGGGTHRLGLGDAILVKNNHLALIAVDEIVAAPIAIERAWKFRVEAAFIEVEVRSEAAALAAARTFRCLQQESGEFSCLILLDNMTPEEIKRILESLRRENLWDSVIIEASGGISDANFESYAASGVDAISMGALTHSARAIDLSQKIL
jgi:nicotinate-nucleotide pyrophosphorylase (carboxylating)